MLTIQLNLNDNLQELGAPRMPCRILQHPTTVKDFLEGWGIPHCEIGRVLAGNIELALNHLITRDLDLEVYPARPRHLKEPRFICDQHLGKLARLLRTMGFDTAWDHRILEPEMARRAINEGRVALSRNRNLLKRKTMSRAMLIRTDRPDDQATEVLTRFQLAARISPFTRCPHCNGPVHPVAKEKVRDRIPPRTLKWLDDYYLCQQCDHLYWEGTHVTSLRQRIQAIQQQAAQVPPPSEA